MLVTLDAFGADQLVQECLVGQVALGGFERQVLVQGGDGWQPQRAQHLPHLGLAIRHRRPAD
jgi:hypothetical protein